MENLTTESVRADYARDRYSTHKNYQARAEFNRWLDAERSSAFMRGMETMNNNDGFRREKVWMILFTSIVSSPMWGLLLWYTISTNAEAGNTPGVVVSLVGLVFAVLVWIVQTIRAIERRK